MGASCSSQSKREDPPESSLAPKEAPGNSSRGSDDGGKKKRTKSASSLSAGNSDDKGNSNDKEKLSTESSKDDNAAALVTKTTDNGVSPVSAAGALALSPSKPPPKKGPPLPDLTTFPDHVRQLLLGNAVSNFDNKLRPKVISIYIAGIGFDSAAEHSIIFNKLYMKLRNQCENAGFELQITDLHRGPYRGFLDDQSFKKLCVEQVKNSMNNSAGPNMLILMNQKYNCCTLPSAVASNDFELLLSVVSEESDRALLTEWYSLDENSIPDQYILAPISSKIADYQGTDSTSKLTAVSTWSDIESKLYEILKKVIPEELQMKYLESSLGIEISTLLSNPEPNFKTAVWANRVMTNIDISEASSKNYTDIVDGETDDLADTKLQSISATLKEKLSEDNMLNFQIPWSGGDVDAKYLDSLCSKLEDRLSGLISTGIAEWWEREREPPPKGIPDSMHTELTNHTNYILNLVSGTIVGLDTVLGKVRDFVTGDSTTPFVIVGTQGSGKSTLTAKIASMYETWAPNGAAVVRFCGATPASSSLHQLLNGICAHACILYGSHVSIAAKEICKICKDLPGVLGKVQYDRPLLLVIDNADMLLSDDTALTWIPASLPEYVKIILTVKKDEKLHNQLKNLLNNDNCFLSLPDMSPDDLTTIFTDHLESVGRRVSPEQLTVVGEALSKHPSPLFAQVLAHNAAKWKSSSSPDETKPGQNLDSELAALFNHLEAIAGKKFVEFSLGILLASRHGLTDGEMIELLSCNDDLLQQHSDDGSKIMPSLIWMLLRHHLRIFISESNQSGRLALFWTRTTVKEFVLKRYLSVPKPVHQTLYDYFSGKSFASNPNVSAQLMFNSNVNNKRKLNELPYQMIKSTDNVSLFLENYVWDFSWITSKLIGSGIYDVLADVDIGLKSAPNDADLGKFSQFLFDSMYALWCDGAQLPCQLIYRLRPQSSDIVANYPKLGKLYEHAFSTYPKPILVPVTVTLTDVANDPDTDSKNAEINKIFRVDGNPSHMMTVSQNTGNLIVWNIFEEKPVRTMTGLRQPRDIKLIDDNRGVVLCNRELKIYNIDTGVFEMKLKGMMNQNMPFYGLHDADHVVALSRNRMYVNIMNVNTGDLVSTFKVGEDRFLNSLLVSGNGERVVCGDEVQKPFPLLVWDLTSRKLVYDLRINNHEFLTRMAAITSNGHYVVSVVQEVDDPSPNFIVVYDLQTGQLFKKWKPVTNTCCVSISSESMRVINGCEDCSLMVWDLTTGACSHILRGHTHPVDTIFMDAAGKKFLSFDSTQQDRTVKLWDSVSGECLSSFTPDRPISSCQISADGRRAVIALNGVEQIYTLQLQTEGKVDEVDNTQLYGSGERLGESYDVSKAG